MIDTGFEARPRIEPYKPLTVEKFAALPAKEKKVICRLIPVECKLFPGQKVPVEAVEVEDESERTKTNEDMALKEGSLEKKSGR